MKRVIYGSGGRASVLLIFAIGLLPSCTSGPVLVDAPAPPQGSGSDHPVMPDATPAAPAALTETIPGTTVTFEMLPVPGGTIILDTEEGRQEIEIPPFYMGRTEVTWDEYDVFVFGLDEEADPDEADAEMRPSRPYGSPDFGFGRRGYPALAMSYVGAMAYAEWLSAITGHQYRIPTEAEWEYVCRAGTDGRPDEESLLNQAWFWENAWDKTHPVASVAPNDWGFHDMLGNAAEWCIGLDGEYYVCGGSWRQRADDVHCGARAANSPEWNATDPQIPKSLWWLSDGDFVGFRLVREPDG